LTLIEDMLTSAAVPLRVKEGMGNGTSAMALDDDMLVTVPLVGVGTLGVVDVGPITMKVGMWLGITLDVIFQLGLEEMGTGKLKLLMSPMGLALAVEVAESSVRVALEVGPTIGVALERGADGNEDEPVLRVTVYVLVSFMVEWTVVVVVGSSGP
jgi:hypothetical protein